MTVGHRLSDKPTYGLKASVGETSSPFALFGTPGPLGATTTTESRLTRRLQRSDRPRGARALGQLYMYVIGGV